MEQSQGFLQKYWYYLLVGAVVALVIVLIAARRPDSAEEQVEGEQTNTENSEEARPGDISNGIVQTSGNVSATGALRLSDDIRKGNLMIESTRGRIYIQTQRDFYPMLDKEVALQAEGALNSFAFLGLTEVKSESVPAETQTPAVGGVVESSAPVQVSGRLERTDDASRGNYLILAGSLKVYLQSVQDYSGWLGTDVDLAAQGTIQSFTEARLTKK